MIRTGESIVDPIAFVQANSDIFEAASKTPQGVVLSGADLDVHVALSQEARESSAFSDLLGSAEVVTVKKTVNSFLGDLYQQGSGIISDLSDNRAHLVWYPSPRYVGDLQEAIGLTPGKTALRFIHGSTQKADGIVPPRPFVQHFADGEFPQSTMPDFNIFSHDRNNDHVPGALLMSEVGVHALKKISEEALKNRLLPRSKQKRLSGATNTIDNITGASSMMVSHLTGNTGSLIAEEDVASLFLPPKYRNLYIDRGLADLYDHLAVNAGSRLSIVEKAGYVQREIFEHLTKLQPALDQLRLERSARAEP